jgi:NAD dependent epimerase/dehydratase family enzyme
VAPDHTDNISFMKTLALVMNKPFISPPVPSLFLRLAMGESSAVALKGSRVSSEKLISSGYKFIFPDLESALKDALK